MVIEEAVTAFGWSGTVLPEIRLLGCLLVPVVETDVEAHRSRRRDGDGPEYDGDTLTVWEWPQSPAPASAVRLSGVVFAARRGFGRALRDARRWRAFGPSAVLAPAALATDQVCRWDCALHGVGLAGWDEGPGITGDVVAPEAGRAAPARRRTIDRWIEERLYAVAIDTGLVTE